jgi:hypothetical protein
MFYQLPHYTFWHYTPHNIHVVSTGIIFYPTIRITFPSDRFDCRQAAQHTSLFQSSVSRSPRVLLRVMQLELGFYSPHLKQALETVRRHAQHLTNPLFTAERRL